jgi:hypothetical protein
MIDDLRIRSSMCVGILQESNAALRKAESNGARSSSAIQRMPR